MASSNGNIFRVTDHLCGEFTGSRWIPRTKASDAELWCFSLICARKNGWVNNGEAGDLRRHRAHYDVMVMSCVVGITPGKPSQWHSYVTDDFASPVHHQLRHRPCQIVTFLSSALQWRHNGRDSVSNHQPHDCLLSRLFRRRSKKTSKLRVTGLCVGNLPGTGEFPAQMVSNAEYVSIWWRHHVASEPEQSAKFQ